MEVLHKGAHHAYAVVQSDGTGNYVEVEGTEFSIYSCREQKTLPWAYNTDSGIYEGQGIARMLFDSSLKDSEVEISRVAFFSFADLETDPATAKIKVEDGQGYGAFSADIRGLNPEAPQTIYAFGYVKVQDSTFDEWSALQIYTPDFKKNLAEID